MLDMASLRGVLLDILGIEEKYVVAMSNHQFVPTYDKEDKVGTWVGYRILEKSAYARTYEDSPGVYVRPIRASFRISLVGPQAEEIADGMFLWDDRSDVQEAFEKIDAQVNYDKRKIYSFPIEEAGFNDRLCWCVDFNAQSFYVLQTKLEKWEKGIELQGSVLTGGV